MSSLGEIILVCGIYMIILAFAIPLSVMTFIQYRILYKGLSPEKATNIIKRRGELIETIIYGVSIMSPEDDKLKEINVGNLLFSTILLLILCLGLFLVIIGLSLGVFVSVSNENMEGIIYLSAVFILVLVTLRGFYWGYNLGKSDKIK